MSFISNGVYENQTMSAIAWVHYFYIVSGQTSDFILYPPKTKENLWFPGVFRGYRMKDWQKIDWPTTYDQSAKAEILRPTFCKIV